VIPRLELGSRSLTLHHKAISVFCLTRLEFQYVELDIPPRRFVRERNRDSIAIKQNLAVHNLYATRTKIRSMLNQFFMNLMNFKFRPEIEILIENPLPFT